MYCALRLRRQWGEFVVFFRVCLSLSLHLSSLLALSHFHGSHLSAWCVCVWYCIGDLDLRKKKGAKLEDAS